ncbi:hypothetical protein EI555_001481 [Monodon monoceros]|uniref:Swi5-dependent recombination DNA repair protein 1 homolog n=1 Tax=Monodon monoceros TaxID=40151 RepID=A0A4V5P7P5_MONMO|nr:hypothetical protein EI555_001481 [Monodon monoceros]
MLLMNFSTPYIKKPLPTVPMSLVQVDSKTRSHGYGFCGIILVAPSDGPVGMCSAKKLNIPGEVNQYFIFKMGSLGNTGMILPSTPQACVNPLSPHITNRRKQPISVTQSSKKRLNEEKTKLVKQVQEKGNFLQRLKLVKMYRSKKGLSQTQLLTKRWRSCSQLLLSVAVRLVCIRIKLGKWTMNNLYHYGHERAIIIYQVKVQKVMWDEFPRDNCVPDGSTISDYHGWNLLSASVMSTVRKDMTHAMITMRTMCFITSWLIGPMAWDTSATGTSELIIKAGLNTANLITPVPTVIIWKEATTARTKPEESMNPFLNKYTLKLDYDQTVIIPHIPITTKVHTTQGKLNPLSDPGIDAIQKERMTMCADISIGSRGQWRNNRHYKTIILQHLMSPRPCPILQPLQLYAMYLKINSFLNKVMVEIKSKIVIGKHNDASTTNYTKIKTKAKSLLTKSDACFCTPDPMSDNLNIIPYNGQGKTDKRNLRIKICSGMKGLGSEIAWLVTGLESEIILRDLLLFLGLHDYKIPKNYILKNWFDETSPEGKTESHTAITHYEMLLKAIWMITSVANCRLLNIKETAELQDSESSLFVLKVKNQVAATDKMSITSRY